MIDNIKEYKQVNYAFDNEMKFDSSYSLADIPIKHPQLIVTISLRGGKKSRKILFSGITYIRHTRLSTIMINRKHIKHHTCKLISNEVNYSTVTGLHYTMHDVKAPFIIPDFTTIKIITDCFYINNEE